MRSTIAVCLLGLELYPSGIGLTQYTVIYGFYVLFALAVLWWQSKDQGASDLVRLLVDQLVLLVCVTQPPDRAGWLLGILYLFVLSSASILHQLREIGMVAGVTVLFSAIVLHDQAVSLLPLFVIPGSLAVLLGLQRATIEDRLSRTARQSLMFRTEAENARELERQRIAADFHDGPLQSFISFQMRLEVIKKLLARDQKMAVEDMTQLQEICKKQITDMRAFVRSMRSSADGTSPATSVRQIADDFQKTSGISLSWNVGDSLSGLEPEISHEVLQIVREALHNAQKHSKATKVTLQAEKVDGALQMMVEDDGSGFPFAGQYSLDELELMRMGPESIKRRVRTLNGEMLVQSTPGRGATLRIRVPL
jgi:signal transduction histidine kinase